MYQLFQGKPPDYHDFVGIVVLLLINSTISFVEENNAGNAAAALMAQLAPKAKVLIPFCCDRLKFDGSRLFINQLFRPSVMGNGTR